MSSEAGSEGQKRAVRLMSLDALRGFDMLWIMGFSGVVIALCTLLGVPDCWFALQMKHVSWHGFRHHDTIFPLFLFLAGVSWPFSHASQVDRGLSTGRIILRCVKRMIGLILLGLIAGGALQFDFTRYRYDSVLAHIGVCWFGAAILYILVRNWKARLAIVVALLAAHWLVLANFIAPDAAQLLASKDPAVAKQVAAYAAYGTDNFSFTGNIAGWIDRTFMPGRFSENPLFDADGLFGKVTGIALALLGVLAGELLRSRLSGNRKTVILLVAAAISIALTFAWQPFCPVNKKIWTSTFVLAAAGYSFGLLALFYWIVDVRGFRRWTFFFRVIGMNSITIYMLMRVVSFPATAKFFFGGVASWGNADWSRFVLLLGQVLIEWIVLWYLHRKGTFLKV